MSGEKRNYLFLLTIVFCLTILCSLLSLRIGAIPLPFTTIFSLDFSPIQQLILQLRLPRIFLCWVVGHLLAIAGCLMQILTRNPLGSPDILGIHAGASLAGILFVLFFPSLPSGLLPVISFGGGLMMAMVIFFLAQFKKLSSTGLALAGVALHILCSALIQLVIHLKSMEIHTALTWLAGSFWGRTWDHVYLSIIPLLVVWLFSFLGSYRLSIFTLQDEMIIGLGENLKMMRFSFFLLAVLASGLSVALVGPISFVALLAPQMGKMLAGPYIKRILPLSSLLGTILLLLADTLGRGIAPPLELPAGLLTPIIGVPTFFYLLSKSSLTLKGGT